MKLENKPNILVPESRKLTVVQRVYLMTINR